MDKSQTKSSFIMLIDDQPDWLRINERELDKAGYTCQGYTSGQDAIKELEKGRHKFPLIIIDVNLGTQIDGVKLAQKIYELNNNTVIYLISSASQLKKHYNELENIAEKYGLKYLRKKADEEGGEQILNIARQHIIKKKGKHKPQSRLNHTIRELWAESDTSEKEN